MVYKAVQEKGPWTLAFSATVNRVHLGSFVRKQKKRAIYTSWRHLDLASIG